MGGDCDLFQQYIERLFSLRRRKLLDVYISLLIDRDTYIGKEEEEETNGRKKNRWSGLMI